MSAITFVARIYANGYLTFSIRQKTNFNVVNKKKSPQLAGNYLRSG